MKNNCFTYPAINDWFFDMLQELSVYLTIQDKILLPYMAKSLLTQLYKNLHAIRVIIALLAESLKIHVCLLLQHYVQLSIVLITAYMHRTKVS